MNNKITCDECKIEFDTKRGLSNHKRNGCRTIRQSSLTRKCPICGNNINYYQFSKFNNAIKNNSRCIKCVSIGRKLSEETKRKKSISMKIRYENGLIPNMIGAHSKNSRLKQSLSMSGKKHNKEHNEKIRKSLSSSVEYKTWWNTYGKNQLKEIQKNRIGTYHTDETKKKMRLSAINRMMLENDGKMLPSYNPVACELIDEYGKQNGYNFQHAENGGEFFIKELGYWVDGYDKEKNVVLEVDEVYHTKPSQKEKDIKRQKEIEDFLKCKFIRIPFNKKI